MGIFSSKTIITTAVSTSQLRDPKKAMTLKQTMLKATLLEKDIVESLKDYVFTSAAKKAQVYYSQGVNNPVIGQPSGISAGIGLYSFPTVDIVQPIIESIVGTPMTIIGMRVTYFDKSARMAWVRAKAFEQGMLNEYNGLYNIPGIGSDYSLIDADLTYDEYAVKAQFRKSQDSGASVYFNFALPDRFDEYSPYYVVTYHRANDVRRLPLTWVYPANTSEYPELSAEIIDGKEFGNTLFPVVPIIINKTEVKESTYPDEKAAADSLLRVSGLQDIETFIELLKSNENYADVDDAFIMFGADLRDIKEVYVAEYLYKFFDVLKEQSVLSKEMFESSLANDPPKGVPPRLNKVLIKDKEFNVTLAYHYITHEVITGTGAGNAWYFYGNEYAASTFESPEYEVGVAGSDNNVFLEDTELVLRKRIDDDSYHEIRVRGLVHSTFVYNSRTLVDRSINHLRNDDYQGGFFIPIDKSIMDTMSAENREKLIIGAASLVVYAIHVETLKWYQNPDFWLIVQIAMIIIALYTGYVDFTAILTKQGVQEAIKQVVISLITNYAYTQIALYIANMVSPELFIYVAAALALYGVLGTDAIFSKPLLDLPLATDIMKIAAVFPDQANRVINKKKEELEREMSEYTKSAKEWQEEIENAAAMLSPLEGVDYYDIIKEQKIYIEDVDVFIARTTGITDFDELLIDQIDNYVENKLDLYNNTLVV